MSLLPLRFTGLLPVNGKIGVAILVGIAAVVTVRGIGARFTSGMADAT